MNPQAGTWALTHDIEDDSAIDTVTVAGLLSPERWRIILGLHRDKAVVTTQTPAAAVPLHAATDVASEEGFGISDAEAGALEEAQAAHAARHVWHDRVTRRCLDDQVAAVVQHVRCFHVVQRRAVEVERLCDAERAAHLALDTNIAIESHRNAATEVVVREAPSLRVTPFGEERSTSGDDAD